MNPIDRTILLFLNSFARRSPIIDNVVALFAGNMLLKGGVFVFLFWWLWFCDKPQQRKHREFLLLATIAPLLAVLVARIVAHSLPFRERPLRESTLLFQVPYGMDSTTLQGWSSFPSDHAAFFFAVSLVFLLVSRRAGLFALAYTTVFICFPRVYLGIHYPSDIAAGALIGSGIACLTLITPLRRFATGPMLRYIDLNPSLAYACLSLLTYLIGTVCEPIPELIRFSYRVLLLAFQHIGYPLRSVLGTQSIVESLIILFLAAGLIAMFSRFRKRSPQPKQTVPLAPNLRSLAPTIVQNQLGMHTSASSHRFRHLKKSKAS